MGGFSDTLYYMIGMGIYNGEDFTYIYVKFGLTNVQLHFSERGLISLFNQISLRLILRTIIVMISVKGAQ